MIYQEYKPAIELQEWVECYWKFVVPARTTAFVEPIKHVFPPEGSCSLLFVNIPAVQHKAILFTGPSTHMHEVTVFPGSISVGIRLKPGYSACLHPADVTSLQNSAVPLFPLLPWQQQFMDQLTLDFDDPDLLNVLLRTYCLPLTVRPDDRINKAVSIIITSGGTITVAALSQACCLSTRQLQRLFTKHTSLSIKQFCQIRRLRQAIIGRYVQHKSGSQTAFEGGFVDQAHFYKSFRHVAAYELDKFLKHVHLIKHIIP